MNITKLRISRTRVAISYDNEGEEHSISTNDSPLKAFLDSLQALKPLVLASLELPDTYAGKEPKEGDTEQGNPLHVTGMTVVTKGDARQVCITATKVLSRTIGPFNITVPLRLIDHPTEEGAVSTPYSDKEVDLIEEVIQNAKDYVNGERAQGHLPLEQDADEESAGPAEPEHGDVLAFSEGAASGTGEPAKPKKPRKPKSA